MFRIIPHFRKKITMQPQNGVLQSTLTHYKQFDTTQVCYLRVSFIITIICPLGYIVFDIFGDFVAVMVAAYYMVMIAALPIEFDIIATCESSDSRFYCHDNRRQPRAMMRNQRRVATCGDRQSGQLVQPPMIMRAICIRGRRRHAYNCVKMIGHHYKKRNFHIRKMLVTSSQSLVQRFPGFR